MKPLFIIDNHDSFEFLRCVVITSPHYFTFSLPQSGQYIFVRILFSKTLNFSMSEFFSKRRSSNLLYKLKAIYLYKSDSEKKISFSVFIQFK